jgi:hypothetical protein
MLDANESATSLPALRGIGRLAYRQGGFPHHGVRMARLALGRELTTADRQAVVDGWTAERREVRS